MSITTKFENKGVIMCCTGHITRETLFEAVIEYFNNEASSQAKWEIFDCSNATNLDITEKDVTFFASHDIGRVLSFGAAERIALVGNEEQVLTRLMLYKTIRERVQTTSQIRIFNDFEEARAWVIDFKDSQVREV